MPHLARKVEGNLVREAEKVRTALVVFAGLFLLASPREMIEAPRLAAAGLAVALGSAVVLRVFGDRHLRNGQGLAPTAAALLVSDLAWMMLLTAGTGGFASPLAMLPLLAILFAGVFFGSLPLALPLVTATVIAWQAGLAALAGPEPAVTWTLAGRIMTVVGAGWLAWALARVLERERRANARIVAHLTEGVLLLDEEARVVLANPRMAELLGRPEEELVGRRVGDLPVTGAAAALLADLRGAVLPEKACSREVELEGEAPRQVRVHVLPCGQAGAEQLGWVVVAEDITELREVARLKDEGLAIVTHELRSPLAALRAIFQVLTGLGDRLDAEQKAQALASVNDELKRMAELVSRVLDTAALERGVLHLEPELVSPQRLVARVAQSLRLRAGEKELEVRCEVAPELPWLHADPVRLEMALANLGSNAVQHTPAGGCVTLCAEQVGDCVRLAVSDDGPGIALEQQESIFEKYVRGGEPGGARRIMGLGLGLYVARRIVESHGGTLRLHSAPGEGSTFEMLLPVAQAQGERRAA